MGLFAWPSQLRKAGVMGINMRNADYVMRYNPRKEYPLVDNKLITKKLAVEQNIAVPALYNVISIQHEIDEIDAMLKEYQDFVIKPAHGSGGNGILVIEGKIRNNYRKPNGALVSSNDIKHHASNILSGMYSLGGLPDKAIIEYRVQFDPFFEDISYQGVPDIRVIVFQGIPVTAMVRLPTRSSDGKANLHQGAVGLGINLKSGKTQRGVSANELVNEHPDTGAPIENIAIPNWDNILRVAIGCADIVGLGYLGVDIVIDKQYGPLMLELNARPGLNVQLANQEGLLLKLNKIEASSELPTTIDDRLAYAQSL